MTVVRLLLRPLVLAIVFGFALWITLLLLNQALWVIVAVLLALVLAAAMAPAVRLMRRPRFPPGGWRIPKWMAVLLIYLFLLLLLLFFVFFVAQLVVPQARALISSSPQLLGDVAQRIDQLERALGIYGLVPSGQDIIRRIESLSLGNILPLGQVEALLGDVVFFFFRVFLVLILAIFLIVESEPLMDFWVGLFPPDQRDEVRVVTARVRDKVGYWVLGQLSVATITGVVATLGSYLLGLPFPFLIGVTTALLDLAPVVGPALMAIPAGLLGLAQSPLIAGLAVLLFYGISFLDGHVFTPLITGRFVRLRATLVIIAVPTGLALYGAVGALVAIPVTAGLVVVFDEVVLPWLHGRQTRNK